MTKICKEAVKDIRMPTGLRTSLMHSLVHISTAGNKKEFNYSRDGCSKSNAMDSYGVE